VQRHRHDGVETAVIESLEISGTASLPTTFL
jgi:hypothetical protein